MITKDGSSTIRIPDQVNGQTGLTMDEVPGAGPAIAQTRNGDQRAPIIGVEVDIGTPTNDPLYNTCKGSSTAWTSGGTLTGGTAAGSFSDVIYATTSNDKSTAWEATTRWPVETAATTLTEATATT